MNTTREELDALLVRRALEGLDADESSRLEELLRSAPEADREWADRLVAELDAASVPADAPGLSPGLREAALTRMAAAESGTRSTPFRTAPPTPPPTASPKPRRWRGWAGWAVAAAVATLWLGSRFDPSVPSPAFATVAAAPDAVLADWAPGPDPTGAEVRGQVVWSSGSQEGVMRLEGLRVNAPDDFQYQLWIFDRDRDERYPVDGGVFDMPPGGGAAELPIRAKLEVDEPTLFAVTVERPGGVVVSSRERIATVAEIAD